MYMLLMCVKTQYCQWMLIMSREGSDRISAVTARVTCAAEMDRWTD